jgi:glutamine cyclotransferase
VIARLLLAALLFAGPATAQIPAERARVLAKLPHDRTAFTEGLLIDDGTLYESTGRDSSVRRVDLKTGRVLASRPIPDNLFGEGIVAWKGQLLSVTWHGGQGFRWTMPDLKRVGGWRYTGEGWAMTEDGRSIILSDGTPTLRFLDPVKLTVTHRLTVTADGQPLAMLNELEYVNGEILANVWMTPRIARIDPASGKVKGWIDLSALVAEVGATDRDSVPNGIAYDRRLKRLYVTGKDWPTLYQIALPTAR